MKNFKKCTAAILFELSIWFSKLLSLKWLLSSKGNFFGNRFFSFLQLTFLWFWETDTSIRFLDTVAQLLHLQESFFRIMYFKLPNFCTSAEFLVVVIYLNSALELYCFQVQFNQNGTSNVCKKSRMRNKRHFYAGQWFEKTRQHEKLTFFARSATFQQRRIYIYTFDFNNSIRYFIFDETRPHVRQGWRSCHLNKWENFSAATARSTPNASSLKRITLRFFQMFFLPPSQNWPQTQTTN